MSYTVTELLNILPKALVLIPIAVSLISISVALPRCYVDSIHPLFTWSPNGNFVLPVLYGQISVTKTFAYNPGTLAKTPQIRAFAFHPLYNVDLKRPSHPESLLGGGGGRAVTKTKSYKQSNSLTPGVFHKFLILRGFARCPKDF